MDSRISPEAQKVIQRSYDKQRKYVHIAPGMVNQIYRNGLLSKKTIDRDGYIRMKGSKNYHREYVQLVELSIEAASDVAKFAVMYSRWRYHRPQ